MYNDADGKPEILGDKVFQLHFILRIFHMDWPGSEPWLPWSEEGDGWISTKPCIKIKLLPYREQTLSPLKKPPSWISEEGAEDIHYKKTHLRSEVTKGWYVACPV